MEQPPRRRRIVLPLSRIVLIFLVGALFLFNGIGAVIDRMRGNTTFNNAYLIIYLLIGTLLVVAAIVAAIVRWRSRVSQLPNP